MRTPKELKAIECAERQRDFLRDLETSMADARRAGLELSVLRVKRETLADVGLLDDPIIFGLKVQAVE